jgi:two-component system, chemotaxis family, CheB/CheR fusion protein
LTVIVRDASDAITMQDFEGRILAWNPAAERHYGWSEAEALGLNARDLIPENSFEETLSLVRRLREGDKLEPFMAQRLAKGGRILDVRLTVAALIDSSGRAYAFSTIEQLI